MIASRTTEEIIINTKARHIKHYRAVQRLSNWIIVIEYFRAFNRSKPPTKYARKLLESIGSSITTELNLY